MRDVKILSRVRDMFEILAENEYSLLWELVEDFTCNGHEVSVKSSCQFKHVIIDGISVSINPNQHIQVGNMKFDNGIDFAMYVLECEV